jgi:hypothetical protein
MDDRGFRVSRRAYSTVRNLIYSTYGAKHSAISISGWDELCAPMRKDGQRFTVVVKGVSEWHEPFLQLDASQRWHMKVECSVVSHGVDDRETTIHVTVTPYVDYLDRIASAAAGLAYNLTWWLFVVLAVVVVLKGLSAWFYTPASELIDRVLSWILTTSVRVVWIPAKNFTITRLETVLAYVHAKANFSAAAAADIPCHESTS